MTNEEAIKHGKEQLEIFGGEHREFIELAIKALEQTRWTPVSKRLPKDGQKVLVTTRSGNLIDVNTSIFHHASAFWKHYVIAWMPLLPQPYEAESEDKGNAE